MLQELQIGGTLAQRRQNMLEDMLEDLLQSLASATATMRDCFVRVKDCSWEA
jgi:hypothetical protein